jgi:hypothetical protein
MPNMMALMKRVRVFLVTLLAVTAVSAQGIRNTDIYFMGGPVHTSPYAVPGTTIAVSGSTGFTQQVGYGYQFWQTPAGGVWLDIPMTFNFPGTPTASVPAASSNTSYTVTPGLRLMVPFSERVSGYAIGGAGYGHYCYSPVLESRLGFQTTTHGVIEVGAGVDIRLTRRISIRGEVRDFVTGRGLSGVPGRNHLVIPFGISFHY